MIDFGDLGARVRRYRQMNGLTAAQLAERAGGGLSRSVVANLENGRRDDMPLSQLLSISWALGITPLALLIDLHEPEAVVDTPDGPRDAMEVLQWLKGPNLTMGRLPLHRSAANDEVRRIVGLLNAYERARAFLDVNTVTRTDPSDVPTWDRIEAAQRQRDDARHELESAGVRLPSAHDSGRDEERRAALRDVLASQNATEAIEALDG